jgi:uncharacterized protein YxjI
LAQADSSSKSSRKRAEAKVAVKTPATATSKSSGFRFDVPDELDGKTIVNLTELPGALAGMQQRQEAGNKIEIRITRQWVRAIRFCSGYLTHGTLAVTIVNGQPVKLIMSGDSPVVTRKEIRFDKEDSMPTAISGL